MRRLKEAADIDAVILDSELPYPPLPDTIASLRYDVHLGLLPVRVVYTPAVRGFDLLRFRHQSPGRSRLAARRRRKQELLHRAPICSI